MRMLAAFGALGMLGGAAIAQTATIGSAISDLRATPLSNIEILSLDRFVREWDQAAQVAFPNQPVGTGFPALEQGWQAYSAGLDRFESSSQIAAQNAQPDADVAAVLAAARDANLLIGQLPEAEALRLFVAAQALNYAARAVNGPPQIEYCIFIILCSTDGMRR